MVFGSLLQHGYQGVIIPLHVEDDNGVEVEPQLFPRDDFQQFFQRAATSWQCHAAVTHLGHSLLATVHVGGLNEARHAGMVPVLLYHETGDDAHGLPAGLHAGICRSLHQSHVSGSVDERDAMGGQFPAQRTGRLEESLVNLGTGGCIYCHVPYHHPLKNKALISSTQSSFSHVKSSTSISTSFTLL